ncbi:MAG: flagellar assembly protein FliH [Parashewanella sp.]
MSSSSTDNVTIEDLSASDFEHWQLPDVSQDVSESVNLFGRTQAKALAEEKEESFTPPTLAEIEALQQQAENEAREQGHQQGYQEGLEKGRLDGLNQGHEEGFEQGKQQGIEQGLLESKELLAKLELIVDKLQQPLNDVDTQVEASLLSLATQLAKAIVGVEIKTQPEHIHSVLRQGIDALPLKNQPVSLRLHPQDAELVEQAYSVNQLDKKQWTIEVDASLQVGDCVLNSQKSEVDLRLQSRTEMVLSAINEQQQQLSNRLQRALEQEIAAVNTRVELSHTESTVSDNDVAQEVELEHERAQTESAA